MVNDEDQPQSEEPFDPGPKQGYEDKDTARRRELRDLRREDRLAQPWRKRHA